MSHWLTSFILLILSVGVRQEACLKKHWDASVSCSVPSCKVHGTAEPMTSMLCSGTTDLGEGSVLEDAASPGANEDDSAMLFYHETGLPDPQLTDHQPSHNGNVSKHRGECDAHSVLLHPVQ